MPVVGSVPFRTACDGRVRLGLREGEGDRPRNPPPLFLFRPPVCSSARESLPFRSVERAAAVRRTEPAAAVESARQVACGSSSFSPFVDVAVLWPVSTGEVVFEPPSAGGCRLPPPLSLLIGHPDADDCCSAPFPRNRWDADRGMPAARERGERCASDYEIVLEQRESQFVQFERVEFKWSPSPPHLFFVPYLFENEAGPVKYDHLTNPSLGEQLLAGLVVAGL